MERQLPLLPLKSLTNKLLGARSFIGDVRKLYEKALNGTLPDSKKEVAQLFRYQGKSYANFIPEVTRSRLAGTLHSIGKGHPYNGRTLTRLVARVINEGFVQEMVEEAAPLLTIRESVLQKYVGSRVKKLKKTEGEPTYNFCTTVLRTDLDEIVGWEEIVNGLLSEEGMRTLIANDPYKYLYSDRLQGDLMENSQVISGSNRIDFEETQLYSRVKRGIRERQKLVDWLLSIRDLYHFDTVACREVVPEHRLYTVAREIVKQYQPDVRVGYKGGIPEEYNKDALRKLKKISRGIIQRLMHSDEKPTQEEFYHLLKGIWIDTVQDGCRVEIILMTPEWDSYFSGPIGHAKYYYDKRKATRQANLRKERVQSLANHLDKVFEPFFYREGSSWV